MVRSSGSVYTRQRKRRQSFRKGFRNCSPGRYRLLIQKVKKAKAQQSFDRKYRKRKIKSLWLKRISGALNFQSKVFVSINSGALKDDTAMKQYKTHCAAVLRRAGAYSTWIHCLHVRGSKLNKKIIAQMALGSPTFFYRLSLWIVPQGGP